MGMKNGLIPILHYNLLFRNHTMMESIVILKSVLLEDLQFSAFMSKIEVFLSMQYSTINTWVQTGRKCQPTPASFLLAVTDKTRHMSHFKIWISNFKNSKKSSKKELIKHMFFMRIIIQLFHKENFCKRLKCF